MPTIRPADGIDTDELCPDESYVFIIGCENPDSTPSIEAIIQPIGSQVNFSPFTQLNAGEFSFTVEVDTKGFYEFQYCCTYDD